MDQGEYRIMPKFFVDDPTLENRALQIWLILIGKAHNRQITTYGEVAEILAYKGAGVLQDMLGHISFYCVDNKLPPLTVIVVNQQTGLPGEGLLGVISLDELAPERERVFAHNWYAICPPSPDELSAAFDRHTKVPKP
jgi:putative restriction endonuclease